MQKPGILNTSVAIMAVVMGIYHMISTQTLLQSMVGHYNTHLGMCLMLIFLAAAAGEKTRSRRILYLVLMGLSVAFWGYVQLLWPDLQDRAFFNTPLDLAVGVIAILLVLEATRKEFGLFVPVLTVCVSLYPFIGVYLPEPLHTSSLGVERTISNLSIGLQGGIYALIDASANYIFLFVLFGGLLKATAGATFFLQLAKLVGSKMRGGPAMMAVISSALVGSIIGSGAANVAITGVVTIPLMKKVGYKPEYAAAIEAAASNGGQIMPPVMGITAFAMAGLTGIPYIKIALMAVLPALLYYFCIGTYVFLRAGQLRIGALQDVKVDVRDLVKSSYLLVIPFGLIITLLGMGYSVMYVAFWAIISAMVLPLLRKSTRPSLKDFINGFVDGAKGGAGIGATVACVGPILSTFTVSGLGIKLSSGIAEWSGGHLFVALAIVWVVCIFMGMVGASLTAYLIVSIFAAPALEKMGVPMVQAHFFVMFVAVFAFLTPPVALVSLVAAKLAGATYMKTAWESVKAASAGFLLPFMFIYCPVLLLQPKNMFIGSFRLVACFFVILAVVIGLVGHYWKDLNARDRILAFASATLLFSFLPSENYMLFAFGIVLFSVLTYLQWRSSRQSNALAETALQR